MDNQKQTPAAQFFAAQLAFGLANDRINDLLDAVLGDDGWMQKKIDHYDESIEVYAAKPPTPAVLAALREAGFAKAWFHGHELGEYPRYSCPLHYLRITEVS